MIIGITGGSGCGKTTLLRCIQSFGGVIFDCDVIYHKLLKTNKEMLNSIDARFPGVVQNGELQRKVLGNIVFSNPDALNDLNEITHKYVRAEIEKGLALKPRLAAIDGIALFESGMDKICDKIVAVVAPTEDRVGRLIRRDGVTEEYARKRIAAQHTNEWFEEHCDYVVRNDNTRFCLEHRCIELLDKLGVCPQVDFDF